MSEKCNYLVPDHFGYIAGDYPQERPECMLGTHHDGPHLCRFSDGVIIEWEPDNSGECGCTPQEQEDGECDCFTYRKVTTQEAIKRMQQDGPRK
jgi:hypothetical protein